MIWSIILPDIFRLLLDEDNDIKTICRVSRVCRSFYHQYTKQTTIVAHLQALKLIYSWIYNGMRGNTHGYIPPSIYFRGNCLWLAFVNRQEWRDGCGEYVIANTRAVFELYIRKRIVHRSTLSQDLGPQDFLDLLHTLSPILTQLFLPTTARLRYRRLGKSVADSETECVYEIKGNRLDWGMLKGILAVDPWHYSIIEQSIDCLSCDFATFIKDSKYQKQTQRICPVINKP